MGRLTRCVLVIAALASLNASTSAGGQQPEERLLPNFHRVNEHLYRGAQPLDGGMARLAALGIKTVINLRGEDEGVRAEESDARAAGMRYFSVPMAGLSRPSSIYSQPFPVTNHLTTNR